MLIAISGIDGCGKTLQVNLLKEWFQANGKEVSITKAYDDDAKIACRPFMETWTDDVAIAFLFQALHAQQFKATSEALKAGHVVIADRWDESYLAYHENFGFLSGQHRLRAELNSLAFRGHVPDIGIIIKVPVDIARRRRESRGKVERFEDRPDDYYEVVQNTYCSIALRRKWYVIDGTKVPHAIHENIVTIVSKSVGT